MKKLKLGLRLVEFRSEIIHEAVQGGESAQNIPADCTAVPQKARIILKE